MSPDPESEAGGHDRGSGKRPAPLVVLTVILFAEAAFLLAVVVWLIVEILTTRAASLTTAIAFVVVAALAALWVLTMALGALGSRSWIRGAVITWQIIQVALAVAAFQGAPAVKAAGGALLAVAIAGIVLVLTPAVTRATARRTPGR